MEVTIKTNFDFGKFDTNRLIEMGIHNSLRPIQSIARAGAPVETGTLKKNIWIEEWKNKAGIWPSFWPRKVVYARRREYENYKNPHTKYYMRNAYQQSETIINREFNKAFDIIIKHIQKWVS